MRAGAIVLRPLGPTRQGLMKRCRGAFFLGLWSLLFSLTGWAADSIQPAREVELIHLVRNECGACHGGQLKGGLGPALQPENLRGRTPEGLRETILQGVAGGVMPGWASFLNPLEVDWIVQHLMMGFPHAR